MRDRGTSHGGVHIQGAIHAKNLAIGEEVHQHIDERGIDVAALVAELAAVRAELSERGAGSVERTEALEAIAESEKSAAVGDTAKAAGILRGAAESVGKVLAEIGTKV